MCGLSANIPLIPAARRGLACKVSQRYGCVSLTGFSPSILAISICHGVIAPVLVLLSVLGTVRSIAHAVR